ncbi:MAG: hypothetical protein JRF33_19965 [Deltaproteobacteria bacterium]|nr:hypothetical protein [Deltaproteobacteria bacterium]
MRHKNSLLFCFSFVTLLALSAQAAEPTSVLIDKAAKKYADLDFEGSAGLLDLALANPGNSSGQLVRIHHMKGLIFGALGRYDKAKNSFAVLLALEPSFRLGANVAPRVRDPFRALLSQNPPRFDVGILPPPTAIKGKAVIFTSQVKNDSLGMAHNLVVHFRRSSGQYSKINISLSGQGEYRVSIPAPIWQGKKQQGPISWYAVVEDKNEAQLRRFGDELHPLVLEVSEQAVAPAMAMTEASSWYGKWWVWAIVGGVVAAGATTAVVLSTPSISGGPFDFTVDLQ